MEISNNPETNNAAWQFYASMKDEEAKLSQAIEHEGQPNFDPNNQSSSTQES